MAEFITIPLSAAVVGTYKIGLTPRTAVKPRTKKVPVKPHIDLSIFDNDFGGWILSDGSMEPVTEEDANNAGHDDVSARLGLGSEWDALESGAIRVDLSNGRNTMFEVYKIDDKTRRLLHESVHYAHGNWPVMIEWWQPKNDSAQFQTKEEAISWLEDRTVITGSLSKTAISLPDLVRQTNSFSKKYRGGCQPKLLNSDPKTLFLHYNVKCNKADSDPAGHDVRVQFDVSKVKESQKANDLDIQVSCSCPAFLYWGAQWNLHQRDGLLGPARPLLQAPKERLDLRANYVICKHVHATFERILPSVQHNITNILRKREVDRNKDKERQTPERLQKMQDQLKKKKQLEKIRKTKNEEIKQKLIDALHNEEEARILHEEGLEEQVPESDTVKRDEPATEPHEEAQTLAPTPEPESTPEEEQEIADITDLTDQEEKKIEKLHEEGKPHIHKDLPYEVEEEPEEGVEEESEEESVFDMLSDLWKQVKDPDTRRNMWKKVKDLFKGDKKSSKLASSDELGLLWRAPEDNQCHDYMPSWDYEVDENPDPELSRIAISAAKRIYARSKEPFELWAGKLEPDTVAIYINGTCGYPVILLDLDKHRGYEDQLWKSIDHELKHALQESEGRGYDEEEAEED
jgi:hypothetical protein